MAATLRPFREKTSRNPCAGLEQLVPAAQTGDAGEIITTPATPDAPVPPELCAPQAVAAATETRVNKTRAITAALA